MSFGFGFGFPKNYIAALFSPAQLFTGSTTGVWYDPSDFSTMFRDAAGTTPVTAVEQPVGLMLDKSKGLVLGPELVANGTFGANIDGWSSANNAVISWESEKLQISGNGTTAYPYAVQTISGLTIGKSYRFYGVANKVSGANSQALIQIGAALSGTSIVTNGEMTAIWLATTTSVQVRLMLLGATSTYNFDNISVRELPGNHAFNSSGNSANFPVLSARYNLYTNTETLATQNVTTVATSYKLTFTGSGSITLTGTATGVYTAGSYTISCTAGTLTSTVLGTVTQADLRATNDALNQPAYQRVNTSSDYDTVGFKPYLKFNGANQWLQTNSIDFTYGDKMFVSAGVRKLSAAPGMIAELSTVANNTNGTFYLVPGDTPTGGGNYYTVGSRGTNFATAQSTASYSAPITNAISGIGSISAPSVTLRINGTQAAISTADQGTGNYGNYPLYIGARAGSSLWFNGRIYQLVVAGKQASASEITNTETFINQRTGAF